MCTKFVSGLVYVRQGMQFAIIQCGILILLFYYKNDIDIKFHARNAFLQ